MTPKTKYFFLTMIIVPILFIGFFSFLKINTPTDNLAQNDLAVGHFTNELDLQNWTENALPNILNTPIYSKDSYLNKIKKFFTVNGLRSFMKAMKESETLDYYLNDVLTTTVSVTSTPQIIGHKKENGYEKWEIHTPVSITRTPKNKRSHKQDENIRIVLYTAEQSIFGINQFLLYKTLPSNFRILKNDEDTP